MAVLLAFLEIVYPRLEKLSLQWLYGSAALTRLNLFESSHTSVSKKKFDDEESGAWPALLVLVSSKDLFEAVWNNRHEKYWELRDVCCSALLKSFLWTAHIYLNFKKKSNPDTMSVRHTVTPAHLLLCSHISCIHHIHITILKSKTQDDQLMSSIRLCAYIYSGSGWNNSNWNLYLLCLWHCPCRFYSK